MKELFKEELVKNHVDLANTLQRFMGNEDLLEKFLFKFLEDKNYDGLVNSLEAEEYEEAFKYGHTLKGVTANLGINSVYMYLTPFVEKLRIVPGNLEKAELQDEFKPIKESYDSICATIRKFK